MKKALKNTFPRKKHPSEKKHKETLCFLKPLAGRTEHNNWLPFQVI